MNNLIAQLRSICGAPHVYTHEDAGADLSAWELDWRKRSRGRSLAVVRPGSTAEVAAVVKACAATPGVSIVPQGGNTGLVGGGIPSAVGAGISAKFRGTDGMAVFRWQVGGPSAA